MDDFFKEMREECEAAIRHNKKVDNAFNAFCDELRSAILNEQLDMTFERYDGEFQNYYAVVTVKVYHTLIIKLTVCDNFVCPNGTWLDRLFDKPEDLQALKDLVAKHIKPLTELEKERIRELEDEIDTIKHKYIK